MNRRAFFLLLVAILVSLVCGLHPAFAISSVPMNGVAIDNPSTVVVVAPDGTQYVGGSFSVAGPDIGQGIPLDLTAGVAPASFPKVNNVVSAVVSDGSGGWYIGGSFTTVGAYTRNRLAHILSDNTVDPLWDPNVSTGTVSAIVVSGTTMYVGGNFSTVSGSLRVRVAAIGTDGALQSWAPSVTGNGVGVSAIAISGTTIYLGGNFTQVNGASRTSLAAVDADGTLQSWGSGQFTGSVLTLAIVGTNVYIGGSFSSVAGNSRTNLAALSTTGTIQSWNPSANVSVSAITASGTTLYVAGSFTTIGVVGRRRVAAIGTDGVLQPWNPSVTTGNNANAIAISSNGTIYIGGAFTGVSTTTRSNVAAVTADGTLLPWDPNLKGIISNAVNALAISGSAVYAGGSFSMQNPVTRNGLLAIDSAGMLTSWSPSTTGVVSLAVSGTTVYVGGSFTAVNGTTRNRLAAIGTDGSLLAWSPSSSAAVNVIAVSGTTVYVGGAFTAINGTTRNRLAAIDSAGTLTSWSPSSSAAVNSMLISGSTVYVGGAFTTIDASARSRIAAIGMDGLIQAWSPTMSNSVLSMAASGTTIFAAGTFTTVNGIARGRGAAIDMDGTLQSWNPNIVGNVNSIVLVGGITYIAGTLTSIGSLPRTTLGAVDSDGQVLSWDPNSNGSTSAVSLAVSPSGNILYAAGQFSTLGPARHAYLAQFDITPNPFPSISLLSPNSASVGASALTLTVTGTGFVASSTVNVNGSPRVTTFISSTQVTAAIPATDFAVTGNLNVTVFNPTPGGGTSTAAVFTVVNPVPTLGAFSPNTATVGDAAFTLTVPGMGFVPTSVVNVNGFSRTTTYASSTQLTASILSADLSTAGLLSITVSNPAPGGGTSTAGFFTVLNPSPVISVLSPAFVTTGDAGFALTITGTGFVASSLASLNGSSRVTTYVSSTQLSAAILTADLAIGATSTIQVFNPTPGGGTSTSAVFTVENSPPVISSLSQTTSTVGSAGFGLTVYGSGFVSNSTVNVDGVSRTTVYVSSTQLTASILTGDLSTAGTLSITVFSPTPGGGTSAPQTFTVQNFVPVLDSLSRNAANVGESEFTLMLTGSNFVSTSVVLINGLARDTAFLSSTQLTTLIPSSMLASQGVLSIQVFNPTPGGGTSTSQVFNVLQSTGGSNGGAGGGGGGIGSSGSPSIPPIQINTNVQPQSLLKLPDDGNTNTQEDSAVYYVGTDGMRHAFPNAKVYFTWYSDFSQVQIVGLSQLSLIPLGKNVTYKPGVRMVKFTTVPKVYAIEKGGVLRWVRTEAVAQALYGLNWNMYIDDIDDTFYSNYIFGTDILSSSDYSPSASRASVRFPSDSLSR